MEHELASLRVELAKLLREKKELRILDAGCGRAFPLDLGIPTHIVGIDIADEVLDQNSDVDEKIRGDVQDYSFGRDAFDAIVCWHVLEHLPRPERALANFVRSLKDGGVIVLAVPNVFSIKGLVTKLTPHRFHVWFYRNVLGRKRAGTEARGPFPTYMRWSISPGEIARFAARNDMTVAYEHLYEAPLERELRQSHRSVDWAWRVLGPLLKALSFGKVEPDLCNSIIVLQKQAQAERSSGPAEVGAAATS